VSQINLQLNLDPVVWTAVWTGALAAVTSLLVWGAFLAAKYAKKTWEVAQKELEMSREAEARGEAVRVAAWLSPNTHYRSLLGVTVANTNPLPVFDVEVKVVALVKGRSGSALVPEQICNKKWANFPPGLDDAWSVDGAHFVQGATPEFSDAMTDGPVADWGSWEVWSGKDDEPGIAVEMSFRDSSGIYWERGIKGGLTKQVAAHPHRQETDVKVLT
jgi:hypothetical protein